MNDRRRSESRRASVGLAVKKVLLLAAAAIVAINVWTGGPILALWVGSRVQGDSGLSMGTVFVVVLCIAIIVFALAALMSWLSVRYDELVGRPPPRRQQYPWLRSMRAEREEASQRERGVTGVERMMILSVVAAVVAFEIWFFFFARNPLPG